MAHKMPHTTGDSTKYRADIHLPAVDAYIDGGWKEIEGHVCPTIEGFAFSIKITRPTLYNWAYKFKDFAEKMDELRLFCEMSLVQGALGDRLKEKTANLILSSAYGYAEKKVVDNQSSDGSMSPKATIDASLLDDASLKAIMAAVIKSDT
jgi:hypothetical protein